MRKLYLNHNLLTTETAIQIGIMLQDSDIKLKELGVKWNDINGEGALAIAEAITVNRELKVLDLSWNKLGVKPKKIKNGVIGRAFGKALRDNRTLVHLDLSFNKIGEEDTQILSEDLMQNRTLIGFHYQGNVSSTKSDKHVGKVDSLGFMKMISNQKQDNAL